MNPYPNPAAAAIVVANDPPAERPSHPTLAHWIRSQRRAHDLRMLSSAVWVQLYRRFNDADEHRRASEPPWRHRFDPLRSPPPPPFVPLPTGDAHACR